MVTSNTVRGDSSYLKTALNKYSSEVDALRDKWKGQSSDSLITKFEQFVAEYNNVIINQMESFAVACDLYEQYQMYKQLLASAQSNYDNAVSAGDNEAAKRYSSSISEYRNKLSDLKTRIKSSLSQASSKELVAVKMYKTTKDDAVAWAVGIANDNDYGYEIGGMGDESGYKYDCASLIASAWQAAGVDLMGYGFKDWHAVSGLENALKNSGKFEKIDVYGSVSEDDLQPGDVLVKEKEHAIMYIGNGQYVAAHGKYVVDNYEDQISVTNYYSGYWDHVYRYNGDN